MLAACSAVSSLAKMCRFSCVHTVHRPRSRTCVVFCASPLRRRRRLLSCYVVRCGLDEVVKLGNRYRECS